MFIKLKSSKDSAKHCFTLKLNLFKSLFENFVELDIHTFKIRHLNSDAVILDNRNQDVFSAKFFWKMQCYM